MSNRTYATLGILFCLLQVAMAQKLQFQKYSLFEGLPNSSVYSVLQDSRGMLWLGTSGGGVARTDGLTFEVYNKTTGLSGNTVRAIYEDREKRIWIGTNQGLDCYDGNKFFSFGKNSELRNANVTSITEDTTGTILVGTDELGLFMIELDEDTIISSISEEQGITSNFVIDIEVDDQNKYWLSLYGGGINVLSMENQNLQLISLIEGLHLPGNYVTCSTRDPSGHMWFGTQDRGIFKIINEDRFTPRMAIIPEALRFLDEETIWDIHWTESGTCWIATESRGLLRYEEDLPVKYITSEQGLPTNQIYRILEDKDNCLWLSTLGNGILRYSGELFTKYRLNQTRTGIDVLGMVEGDSGHLLVATDEGLYNVVVTSSRDPIVDKLKIRDFPDKSTITAIARDQSGLIWLGTDHGLYELKESNAVYSKYNSELSSIRIRELFVDHQNWLWVGTGSGFNLCYDSKVFFRNEENQLINNEIETIYEDREQNIWMGTMGGLVKISDKYRDFDEQEGLMDLQIHSLIEDFNGDLLIGTVEGGIYRLKSDSDSVKIKQVPGNNLLSSRNIYSLIWENPTTLIAVSESGFDKVSIVNDTITHVVHYDSDDGYCDGSNNANAIYRTSDGLIWFGTSNSLVSYNQKEDNRSSIVPLVYISDLRIDQQKIDWTHEFRTSNWFHLPEELVLSSHQDHLSFYFTAISYDNPKDVEFSYLLEGWSKSWSAFKSERSATFQGLPPGEYKLKLKAKTKYGIVSQEATFEFRIKPPYWLTYWFIISIVILLIFTAYLIVRFRIRKLEKEKEKLKRTVEFRTWEITQQKEQIEEQRDILARQQEEITDSIEYARHIQQAILPGATYLNESVKDSFILLLPQHIVSGDFYWIGKYESHLVLIAADCTGHGVPGAFMSMLGISFLNKIVNEKGIVSPRLILNALRANILNVFNQSRDADNRSKDGMDLAMCSFDLENRKLYFAGAMNPLYQITQDEDKFHLIEHEPDQMPVGNHPFMDSFKDKEIRINEGDTFYMFSDGFSDQFGGPKGKKFMKRRFKNMLLSNQSKTMKEQKEIYHKTLTDWIIQSPKKDRDYPQTDDILIMGVRL